MSDHMHTCFHGCLTRSGSKTCCRLPSPQSDSMLFVTVELASSCAGGRVLIHVHIHDHPSVRTDACTHICTPVRTNANMHARMFMHMSTHTSRYMPSVVSCSTNTFTFHVHMFLHIFARACTHMPLCIIYYHDDRQNCFWFRS